MPALHTAKKEYVCSHCQKLIRNGHLYVASAPSHGQTMVANRHTGCHLAVVEGSSATEAAEPLTPIQAELVLHALGVGHDPKVRPYRNYYVAPAWGSPLVEELDHLVRRGVFRTTARPRVYHVTEAGAFMVGQTIPEEG